MTVADCSFHEPDLSNYLSRIASSFLIVDTMVLLMC